MGKSSQFVARVRGLLLLHANLLRSGSRSQKSAAPTRTEGPLQFQGSGSAAQMLLIFRFWLASIAWSRFFLAAGQRNDVSYAARHFHRGKRKRRS
ncbi:unnamed protein product [Amoebophrya sp. A120]|nr:unnamed protein product [Amoebophrya sp. A120]|eukprot:GSA120T00012620001.1